MECSRNTKRIISRQKIYFI